MSTITTINMAGLTKAVSALSQKLGVTIKAIFAIYVKQAHVVAIIAIIGFGFIEIVIFGILICFTYLTIYKDYDFSVPACVSAVLWVLIFFLGLAIILTTLMNPHYWAFTHLMRDLMGK